MRRVITGISVAVALLAVSGGAARALTAEGLVRLCESGQGQATAQCDAYVAAVFDAVRFGRDFSNLKVCPVGPETVTVPQMKGIVIPHLKQHFAGRMARYNAFYAGVTAFARAWPCPTD